MKTFKTFLFYVDFCSWFDGSQRGWWSKEDFLMERLNWVKKQKQMSSNKIKPENKYKLKTRIQVPYNLFSHFLPNEYSQTFQQYSRMFSIYINAYIINLEKKKEFSSALYEPHQTCVSDE